MWHMVSQSCVVSARCHNLSHLSARQLQNNPDYDGDRVVGLPSFYSPAAFKAPLDDQ